MFDIRSFALVCLLSSACAVDLGEPPVAVVDLELDSGGRPWLVNAEGTRYLLDTGVPRTRVIGEAQPDGFAAVSVHPELGALAAVTTPAAEFPESFAGDPNFGGFVASYDLANSLTFDFRSRVLVVSGGIDSEMPSVPVQVVGGGESCSPSRCWSFNANRIVVEIGIGDDQVMALLDTGAPRLVVPRSIVGGKESEAKLQQLKVGEQIVSDVEAEVVDDTFLSQRLARLRVETGVQVGAVLGISAFKDSLSIDYAAERIQLR